MAEKITFTVNGRKRTIELEGWEMVLDVLRDKLNLTGAKRGCDDNSCGACVVVVNGAAVRTCHLNAKKIDGAEIVTIEGLAKGQELHPIQTALIECGAVQCGYCTPGIVLELYALYQKNVNADREAIMDALAKHLCRCTGYEAILKGALQAQKQLQGLA